MLLANVKGSFGCRKLNGRKLDILDSRMESLKEYCPSDFNRRPNKLSMFSRFKGTEYRQFLLYTAPAVLKDVFSDDFYRHTMLLHGVIRFLNF